MARQLISLSALSVFIESYMYTYSVDIRQGLWQLIDLLHFATSFL